EPPPYGSKTADLSYSHTGLYGCTDKNGGERETEHSSSSPSATTVGRQSRLQIGSPLTDSTSGCIAVARPNTSAPLRMMAWTFPPSCDGRRHERSREAALLAR